MSNEVTKQFSMEDYLTDEEKIKMNIVKEKIVEENNELDGIIKVIYGNEIYLTWKVEFIRPYIIKFLKEKCIDSLIIPEIDKIDITIFNKNIDEITPVEIQKSTISKSRLKNGNYSFNSTQFEERIRRQIEINIKYSGICWFFFDSEYLRYLQNDNLAVNLDIDMTWLIKLMKENKLKAFTIKYDGNVKELTTKDFDFLILSEDQITLNKNKLKIYRNVIFGYKFTEKEIYGYLRDFYNNHNDNESLKDYCSKSLNDRCRIYGDLLKSIANSRSINDMLSMNYYNKYGYGRDKFNIQTIGIFDNLGTYGHGYLTKFVDRFDICKYFPGYIRNKKQWESYRDTNINHSTFTSIVNGSLKFSKTLMDY